MKDYKKIFESVQNKLEEYNIRDFENSQFEEMCTLKALEIQRNFPNGRSLEEIKANSRYGYMNEFILEKALNAKSNDLDFDPRNPESFCYDLYSDEFGKIEVKSWNSNKAKWLNFNINSNKELGDDLLNAGHFDTLCKYSSVIDLVITVYQENNKLKLSGVFHPSVFQITPGQKYGRFVKESRVLSSGQKTTNYLNVPDVIRNGLGWV